VFRLEENLRVTQAKAMKLSIANSTPRAAASEWIRVMSCPAAPKARLRRKFSVGWRTCAERALRSMMTVPL